MTRNDLDRMKPESLIALIQTQERIIQALQRELTLRYRKPGRPKGKTNAKKPATKLDKRISAR